MYPIILPHTARVIAFLSVKRSMKPVAPNGMSRLYDGANLRNRSNLDNLPLSPGKRFLASSPVLQASPQKSQPIPGSIRLHLMALNRVRLALSASLFWLGDLAGVSLLEILIFLHIFSKSDRFFLTDVGPELNSPPLSL